MPTQQDSVTERRRPITVVVVDDEQMIRAALAQTLAGGGFDLVGEAANAQDALRLVVDVRPDVVLMDSGSPTVQAVQAIEQLALLAPTSRILILTRTEQNRAVEAIVAGATGYILKTAPPKAIIAAVRATAAGNRSSPPRSPRNSYSASTNATYPSRPPATTPRARSAPS
jgi:DNA-binding NarL/FixJ family response regulator